MMIRDSKFALILIAALVVAGCDAVGGSDDERAVGVAVFVANQGNFSDGNGSVSVYDPETEDVRPAAVSSLGSIVQSISVIGDRLYIMSNSGNRIDVFDSETLEQVAQISDVISPRYLLADGSVGYVTNLYDSSGSVSGGMVTVLDLASNTKGVEIEVGNNPEGLALVGSRLYVANHGFGKGSTLSVIDANTQTVVDSIDVDCDGPRFLLSDPDADVFVFCTGQTLFDENFNVIGETDGAVRILDGETGTIQKRIAVDGRIGTAGHGQDAFLDEESETIFAIKDEETILVFDTQQNALSDTIGPINGEPVSAVAYGGQTERLFLGRSNGFTTAGAVSIHMRDGTEVGRFTAGIVPTFIVVAAAEGR